jgi:hypothetical protein
MTNAGLGALNRCMTRAAAAAAGAGALQETCG